MFEHRCPTITPCNYWYCLWKRCITLESFWWIKFWSFKPKAAIARFFGHFEDLNFFFASQCKPCLTIIVESLWEYLIEETWSNCLITWENLVWKFLMILYWINDGEFVSGQYAECHVAYRRDDNFAVNIDTGNHPRLLILHQRSALPMKVFCSFWHCLRNHRCFSFLQPVTELDRDEWTSSMMVLDYFLRFYLSILIFGQIN